MKIIKITPLIGAILAMSYTQGVLAIAECDEAIESTTQRIEAYSATDDPFQLPWLTELVEEATADCQKHADTFDPPVEDNRNHRAIRILEIANKQLDTENFD